MRARAYAGSRGLPESGRSSVVTAGVPGILRGMSFLRPLTRSARDGVGQPVLRKDDARLLVGDGCYSDDVNLPGQAYAYFVRSPHAHARVGRIEIAAAGAPPGVVRMPARAPSCGRYRDPARSRRGRRRAEAAHSQPDAGESSRGDYSPPARRVPGPASADPRRPGAVRG